MRTYVSSIAKEKDLCNCELSVSSVPGKRLGMGLIEVRCGGCGGFKFSDRPQKGGWWSAHYYAD